MFFFGDDQALVDLYICKADDSGGPGLPRAPMDELSLRELAQCAIYLRIAYKMALNEDASDEVLLGIVKMYDEVFAYRCLHDQLFFKRVVRGKVDWLGGYAPSNVTKYKKLSGMRDKNRLVN